MRAAGRCCSPSSVPTPPPVPSTVADLVEGGTLAYQITIGEKFRILALSTANFIDAQLTGLRPDLVIAAVGGRSLHDYPARLMRALNNPTWVLPTPDSPSLADVVTWTEWLA